MTDSTAILPRTSRHHYIVYSYFVHLLCSTLAAVPDGHGLVVRTIEVIPEPITA